MNRLAIQVVQYLRLFPRIEDSLGFSIDETGVDDLGQHGIAAVQRLDDRGADLGLAQRAVMPVGQERLVGRSHIVHLHHNALWVFGVKRVSLRPDQAALEEVADHLNSHLVARPVGIEPDHATAFAELANGQKRKRTAGRQDRGSRHRDFVSAPPAALPKELLLAAFQLPGNEVLPSNPKILDQGIFTHVRDASQTCDFWRSDGITKCHKVYAVIPHERVNSLEVFLFRGVRVGDPDDRPVARMAFPVEQIVVVQPLLIEAQDVERQPPGLQQPGDSGKLAVSFDDVAGRIVPLVGDNNQKAVRLAPERAGAEQADQKKSSC